MLSGRSVTGLTAHRAQVSLSMAIPAVEAVSGGVTPQAGGIALTVYLTQGFQAPLMSRFTPSVVLPPMTTPADQTPDVPVPARRAPAGKIQGDVHRG
jgi:hypothetical protein